MHRRKTGRPRRRLLSTVAADQFLRGRSSVRSIACTINRSIGATHDRLRRRITTMAGAPAPTDRAPEDGPLVLIADALWAMVSGERWTVSVVLLRPVHGDHATIAVVHPARGSESHVSWHRAIHRLPVAVRNRVVAATTDGHRGLRDAIRSTCRRPMGHAIPLQRCAFHVLAECLRRIGKKLTRREPFAARAWVLARAVLREPRAHQRYAMIGTLTALIRHPRCPERTHDAVRWFLRQIDEATVCYRHTHHRMPSTTACAEASCKQLRRLLTRIRPTTESALTIASDLYFRMSHPIRCKSHRVS